MDEETKTPETTPEEQPDTKPDSALPEETKPKPDPGNAPESPQTAPEQAVPDEVQTLRAQLARATAERTAAIEAAKLGIDPKQVPYVLRLAELPENGKAEDIAAAIQKVLDDVPAFRNAAASGNRPEIRIGAKSPQEDAQSDALARAFGNTPKK